ncbi:MAG TPA: Dyp-type peroxidase [Gemmatimonadales bacterium]|nr:Dyp-type peroxidase [Gemmatimonadales bacterium]HUM17502.1 Dyp-type peroxidase [Candidatus Nitrosotalea sp.]
MSTNERPHSGLTRRQFLTAAAATPVAFSGLVTSTPAATSQAPPTIEPFWGHHQAGIATPMQRHTYFIAFDLIATTREEVVATLRAWTDAAAKLAGGPPQPGTDATADRDGVPEDSGATLGLPPARLTITFGFGPGLFTKDGSDRYGLARQRPAALADLPRFPGDQLVAERTGGDLSIQACADDPQVAEHAVRRLVALAKATARIRWAQPGFSGNFMPNETPRNQMGFKDGTMNVSVTDEAAMSRFVWVGDEGPAWMRDGTYLVIRPIRIALEHWDRMKLGFQEETIGRSKASGAPIGKQHEFDPLDLDATDGDGNPVIAENAHVRLAAPESNDGAQILRRSYSYDNGVAHIAERWPPWRQLTTFDAGLLFQCYQQDPRTGFSKIFDNMSRLDMLNQFTTHFGSGLFACPPGARRPGEYIGQRLFETG